MPCSQYTISPRAQPKTHCPDVPEWNLMTSMPDLLPMREHRRRNYKRSKKQKMSISPSTLVKPSTTQQRSDLSGNLTSGKTRPPSRAAAFLVNGTPRIVPLMMVTYTLQSYDKGIISAATQFGFNTDLGLTVTIGHTKAGVAITDNKKYSDASMMFYIGYLCGTYPIMYLSQRYSTSRVLALTTFFWGTVRISFSSSSVTYCSATRSPFLSKYFANYLAGRAIYCRMLQLCRNHAKPLLSWLSRICSCSSFHCSRHLLVDTRRTSTSNWSLV